MGELASARGVEGDWTRRNNVQGIGYDGRRGGKHGVTSGTGHDSKRVGTRLLAGDKSGQHGKRKHAKTDVPGPSRPPPSHLRRPTEPVDPPRRRGRLKARPRKIRRSKSRRSTYRLVRPRRGQSGRIERIGYVVYKRCWGAPHSHEEAARLPYGRSRRVQQSQTARLLSRGATFHIRKPLECCTFGTLWTFHLLIHSSLEYKRYTSLFFTYFL